MTRPPPNSTLFPSPPLSRSRKAIDFDPPFMQPRRLHEEDVRLPADSARTTPAMAHPARYMGCILLCRAAFGQPGDRKSTRLNSSHLVISYAVFCLKKKTHCPHRCTPPYSSSPRARTRR